MLREIAKSKNVTLDIRIGLSCGACEAGVIGETRPKFAIRGPDAESAAKMEKQAANSAIALEDEFRRLLDNPRRVI